MILCCSLQALAGLSLLIFAGDGIPTQAVASVSFWDSDRQGLNYTRKKPWAVISVGSAGAGLCHRNRTPLLWTGSVPAQPRRDSCENWNRQKASA